AQPHAHRESSRIARRRARRARRAGARARSCGAHPARRAHRPQCAVRAERVARSACVIRVIRVARVARVARRFPPIARAMKVLLTLADVEPAVRLNAKLEAAGFQTALVSPMDDVPTAIRREKPDVIVLTGGLAEP